MCDKGAVFDTDIFQHHVCLEKTFAAVGLYISKHLRVNNVGCQKLCLLFQQLKPYELPCKHIKSSEHHVLKELFFCSILMTSFQMFFIQFKSTVHHILPPVDCSASIQPTVSQPGVGSCGRGEGAGWPEMCVAHTPCHCTFSGHSLIIQDFQLAYISSSHAAPSIPIHDVKICFDRSSRVFLFSILVCNIIMEFLFCSHKVTYIYIYIFVCAAALKQFGLRL